GDVGTRVSADHLGGEGLAVVGGHFDLVGAINHVVVGDGIAVSRNKKSGTLAGHHATAAARGTPQAGRQAILSAEATEEAFHRRSRLERRVIIVFGAVVLGELLVDVDLHRDHRRFHAFDNVGETYGLSDLAH